MRLVRRAMAFIGPESAWAAEAAECAADQGRYHEYYEALFEHQGGENEGVFAKTRLPTIARELGLDGAAFESCLVADRHLDRVRAESQAGADRGVESTPTLFVNGRKLTGVPTFDQLRTMVESAERHTRQRER